ncbi:hypothetical protein B5X24_HaOG212269 [Helicoverpa armigera]|uniref:DNA/RNA non-specific endonuclease/pyrophosphatase/phosphodiesterase domain-containing protein n=1 Tax=Helicoverpa armigera TaxID=29058 RepID=A0A2W1B9N6_HELAM|nr:hypothetical protein B5X24_HaOG212269 [Helicoverpa armigera]
MSDVSREFFLILIFNVLICNVTSDCVLSLNKDFSSPGPVFLKNGDFLEVNTANGNITMGRSEVVTVACPGHNRKVVLGTVTMPYDTMEAHCLVDKTFRVDRRILTFKEIKCNTQPWFTAQEYPETCHEHSSMIYHVGYKVKNSFHTIYEACFDKRLLRTHYVKHRLTPLSIYKQHGLTRPAFIDGNLFRGVKMNEIYKFNNQKTSLDAILGHSMSGHYLTKKQFLSRGHLAANADYPTSALIRATFHYVNSAPQWQRGNAGDWAALEELVYDPIRKLAAVFITINSSFYSDKVLNSLVFCQDICEHNREFSWLKWRANDGTFSFCCDYKSFVEEVDYLPKLDVRGRFH